MDEITISVKELYEIAKQMLDDKMDWVTVSILDADGTGENALPPSVSLEAFTDDAPYEGIVYDDIDAASP